MNHSPVFLSLIHISLARIDSVLSLAPLPQAAHPKMPADGSVEVDDVSFSYDGKTDVLHHISLHIEPGQTAALVGPSGGGKSTLANLIARFLDVYKRQAGGSATASWPFSW